MATTTPTTRAPSALLAILAAALIGTVPIMAALISAPSAEVAR
ncbi:MAG: hypothetical protein ABIO85_00350 [Sphingomicrobium sp.]